MSTKVRYRTLPQYCQQCGKRMDGTFFPVICPKCNFKHRQRVDPVAVVIISVVRQADNGGPGILLIKRNKGRAREQWAFPGGYIHHGERAEQAAVREVCEETGITLPEDRLQYLSTRTSEMGELLIFFGAEVYDLKGHFNFSPDGEEVAAIRIINSYEPLGFPTHSEMLQYILHHRGGLGY